MLAAPLRLTLAPKTAGKTTPADSRPAYRRVGAVVARQVLVVPALFCVANCCCRAERQPQLHGHDLPWESHMATQVRRRDLLTRSAARLPPLAVSARGEIRYDIAISDTARAIIQAGKRRGRRNRMRRCSMRCSVWRPHGVGADPVCGSLGRRRGSPFTCPASARRLSPLSSRNGRDRFSLREVSRSRRRGPRVPDKYGASDTAGGEVQRGEWESSRPRRNAPSA